MSRATPLHRHDFPILREMQTRWDDNDVYGHLNNTVHYKLFDSVLNIWLIENDLIDPVNSKVISLVVSTGCSYFAELAFPQTILAGLRVERIGRTSITYTFGLFGEGDRAAAQGHLTHVLVDRVKRTPCAIPEGWLSALNDLQPVGVRAAPTDNSKPSQPRPTRETTL